MSFIGQLSHNHILAGLPDRERDVVLPSCELRQVHLGEIVEETGQPIAFLHFPVDAAISLTNVQDDRRIVEVTVTGREGCVGSSVVQGSDHSPCMAMVQIGGTVIRIATAAVMRDDLSRLPFLRAALARYNLLLLRHAVLSVGCSQFHSAPQRLARWLKAHWHRTGLEVFPFTADFLAAQAGLDRKIARDVLDEFQRHGLVQTGRNHVTITNHEGLSDRACHCFRLAKDATDEYLLNLLDLARAHGS